jgi:hypothetical protein
LRAEHKGGERLWGMIKKQANCVLGSKAAIVFHHAVVRIANFYSGSGVKLIYFADVFTSVAPGFRHLQLMVSWTRRCETTRPQ